MGVKCDHCDKEATVHDIAIVKGKNEERHLCEDHAKEMGVIPGVWHSGVGHLVQSVVLSKSGAAAQRSSSEQACPSCGLTFGEFRKEGLLGCAECYTAFEDRLGPLLERAHEGGGHHTGKVPRRAGASLERQQQLGSLRRSLQHAIDHEQYENAARLRDEIASLENGTRDPRSESPANRIQSGDAAPDDIDARDDVSSRPPRPGD